MRKNCKSERGGDCIWTGIGRGGVVLLHADTSITKETRRGIAFLLSRRRQIRKKKTAEGNTYSGEGRVVQGLGI